MMELQPVRSDCKVSCDNKNRKYHCEDDLSDMRGFQVHICDQSATLDKLSSRTAYRSQMVIVKLVSCMLPWLLQSKFRRNSLVRSEGWKYEKKDFMTSRYFQMISRYFQVLLSRVANLIISSLFLRTFI